MKAMNYRKEWSCSYKCEKFDVTMKVLDRKLGSPSLCLLFVHNVPVLIAWLNFNMIGFPVQCRHSKWVFGFRISDFFDQQ